MIRKIAVIALLSAFFTSAYSQETTPKRKGVARPDIPGTFVLELGLNAAPGAPSRFDKGFWGSRTLNIYYQYDIRILKSRFSLVPGVGFSLERFKFVNGYTLKHQGDSLALLSPVESGYPGMRKSQLITNFFEIPVEITYRSNPDDPGRSFKASIGYRVGYLYDAFTKIKYKEDSEVKQLKNKQFYDLSRFRHGFYGKVGIGNVTLFTYYNLNPFFEKGKGPVEKGVPSDFNTFTMGISLASF